MTATSSQSACITQLKTPECVQAKRPLSARRFGDSADGGMNGIPEDGPIRGWEHIQHENQNGHGDLMSSRHSDILGSRSHMLGDDYQASDQAEQPGDGRHLANGHHVV